MGGTGFIGSAVLRQLLGEADAPRTVPQLRVLSRRPPTGRPETAGLRYLAGDLMDRSTLRGSCSGADVLVHTASYVGRDSRKCHDINYAGTQALLEEAQRAGVRRVVYVSTASVYGLGPHRGLREGELGTAPGSPASASRLGAERAVRDARGIVLRPHLVYGAGDRWFVPALARLLRRVPAWPMGVSSAGSLVAVDDLARIVAALVRAPLGPGAEPGEPYHVAHPSPVRMRRLVLLLCGLLGLPQPRTCASPEEHRVLAARGMPELSDHQHALLTQDHWYDSSRIWRRTGVDPGPGFEDRFAQCADWYRRHLADGVGT
ncbi:NAD(P)-dependent oxidoreductase [Streptomyces sp. NPDC096095]|uniref:NAD-dependent epimerase/dehydratase family protein n=1 Tax=Streptomyces sp. NPDC096095 TaxID=3155545 RepID=UPI0033324193